MIVNDAAPYLDGAETYRELYVPTVMSKMYSLVVSIDLFLVSKICFSYNGVYKCVCFLIYPHFLPFFGLAAMPFLCCAKTGFI